MGSSLGHSAEQVTKPFLARSPCPSRGDVARPPSQEAVVRMTGVGSCECTQWVLQPTEQASSRTQPHDSLICLLKSEERYRDMMGLGSVEDGELKVKWMPAA